MPYQHPDGRHKPPNSIRGTRPHKALNYQNYLDSLKKRHVSPSVIDFLSEKGRFLLPDLLAWQQLAPFPADYQPQIIEIRFEDVTYVRCEAGKPAFVLPCLPDYRPKFTEYYFDEQIAFFDCCGEILIDRLQNLKKIHLLED